MGSQTVAPNWATFTSLAMGFRAFNSMNCVIPWGHKELDMTEWLSLKAFYFYYLIWSLQTPWEVTRGDINIVMSLIKGVRMGVELVLKVTVMGRPRARTMDFSPSAPRSWALSAPVPQTASSQLSIWYFCPPNCSTYCFLFFFFLITFHILFTIMSCPFWLPWWLRWWRICLQWGRPRFDPWVSKIPWRRAWQPTPVFLPGEFHGHTSLAGYSPWGHKESDMTEQLSTAQPAHSTSKTYRRSVLFSPSPPCASLSVSAS